MKKEIKKERLPDLFGGLVDAQHYSEYYAKTLKKCRRNRQTLWGDGVRMLTQNCC